jgi:hypothetical protein
MPRLYHKNLPDGQNVIDVPDNPGTVEVLAQSGWSERVPSKYQEAEPANIAAPSESPEEG